MKKYLFILLTLALMMTCVMAMAEAVDAVPVLFDGQRILTDIVVWLIRIITGAVLSGLGWVSKRYVVPWLKDKRLTAAAKEVVQAMEANFGRHFGADKMNAALDKMVERGFKMDKEPVLQALQAAWWALNAQMIELGLKEAPEEEPAGEPDEDWGNNS